MLNIKKIVVETKDNNTRILNDFSLDINDGEIHAIMGPNGTGKSTLSKVIMGSNKYNLISGDILLDGESITSLTVDERAKKKIFLAMQDPTVVDGVTNSEFIKTAIGEITGERINYFDFIKEIDESVEKLKFNAERFESVFPKNIKTNQEKEDFIYMCVEEHNQRERAKKRAMER